MPCSPVKARRLLKEKKAVVKRRTPFTVQLTQATGETVQPVTLGVDAGSKSIGLSASTDKAELYASENELRTDVVDLLSTRRACRPRKTRHRAPRFDNRVHNKQKIKNQAIEGTQHQQGDQLGFWNVREYVLFRDGHKCCHCRGKSKDPILNVHHLESRKTGGDAPNNLITLCETCHKAYHAGKIVLKQKRGQSFHDAAFMGIMRRTFFNRLTAQHPEIEVQNTCGYITKNNLIQHGVEKTHHADAFCIAGNFGAMRLGDYFLQKQTRKHNRQIHKMSILKGGVRKAPAGALRSEGLSLVRQGLVRRTGSVCPWPP